MHIILVFSLRNQSKVQGLCKLQFQNFAFSHFWRVSPAVWTAFMIDDLTRLLIATSTCCGIEPRSNIRCSGISKTPPVLWSTIAMCFSSVRQVVWRVQRASLFRPTPSRAKRLVYHWGNAQQDCSMALLAKVWVTTTLNSTTGCALNDFDSIKSRSCAMRCCIRRRHSSGDVSSPVEVG